MNILTTFTYHIIPTNIFQAFKILYISNKLKKISGLIHMECMSAMNLGSSIFSISRCISNRIILFVQWENQQYMEEAFKLNHWKVLINKGWYVQLQFARQWGSISEFKIPKIKMDIEDNQKVVAVTIAKMKYMSIPRFLKWGLPVEKLVRDNPYKILSLGSIRYPNTISTFSIWPNMHTMTDMVHGHNNVPDANKHKIAMHERDRKDFHYEFTTLRFIPLNELGTINGKSNIIL